MSEKKKIDYPPYLAICGAAGSGNTFLLECLCNHPNTYGIDEDGFGALLKRLLESEKKLARCPHAVSAFKNFVDECRGARDTLIFKTPSNIKHLSSLKNHLPGLRVIVTLREPYSAISSGLRRHTKLTVKQVIDAWIIDLERVESCKEEIVCFEDFIRDPTTTLHRLNDTIMPISDQVMRFAMQNRRQSKLDSTGSLQGLEPSVKQTIESAIKQERLIERYVACRSRCYDDAIDPADNLSSSTSSLAKFRETRFRAKKILQKWIRRLRH